MQTYCGLIDSFDCTSNSPGNGFSLWRLLKSWVGYRFSTLHSYYRSPQKFPQGGQRRIVQAMGVHRNFSRWGNVDISLILFQVTDDAMQMDFSQNALPFLKLNEISPWYHALRSHLLTSFSGGVVFEFAKRLFFLSSFTAFAKLEYHPILLWTADNWVWIWTLTIHNCVCGAHISLCGLNLTS